MSSRHCSTFFASPFFCSPSLLAILSVDMHPVLSPLLTLTGPSILAHPSSPSFVLCVCGGSCPASPFTHTSLAFSLPSLTRYSSPPCTSLPFWERDLASDPQL